MKKLLGIVVLGLFLITSSWADDISDFEIEGMSIGDSLLNNFTEREIKENIQNYYDNSKIKKFYAVEIYKHKKFEVYDSVQFSLKVNDKDYVIYHIVGLVFYENNINRCYEKQKEVVKELMFLFKNAEKLEGDIKHPADDTGKSKIKEVNFWFKSGDVAGADCYDWSDEVDWVDHLRVGMISDEYNIWLKEEQNK